MKFTGALYPFQEEAVRRALDAAEQGFAFFMEMGTGKTRAALRVAAEQRALAAAAAHAAPEFFHDAKAPSLIVCPLSVIDSWQEEIEKTMTGATSIALVGTRLQREKLLKKRADFYIVNYEGLAVLKDALLHPDFEIATLILDESHKIANRTTTQSKLAASLARKSAFVLLLSGTPVRNDARDLWHQLFVIDGGKRLGPKFLPFQASHFINVSRTRIPNWVPRRGSEDKITRAIADVCYRVKKSEVLSHLPPKIYEKRVVEMTTEQRDAYIDMAEEMLVEMEKGEVATARTMLTKYLRLHQIAQGFLYDDDKTVVASYEPNPKTRELLDILAERDDRKSIVWCIYRHTIHDLLKTLNGAGYHALALYGETSHDAGSIVRAFNDGPANVLIGQPQAGGLGINLTAADLAVYYTNSWSHVERSQSEDRDHREGSQIHSSVTYVDLIARGTIDVKILSALAKKKDIAEVLTDFKSHLYELKGAA